MARGLRPVRPTSSFAFGAHLPLEDGGDEARILEAIRAGGLHLVHGPWRSGKSTLLLRAACEALRGVREPRDVVVLAPTRSRAAALTAELARLSSARVGAGVFRSDGREQADPSGAGFGGADGSGVPDISGASAGGAHGGGAGERPVLGRAMTPLAYAFALVREAELESGRPSPALVTGAEFDGILLEILREGVIEWPADLSVSTTLAGFRTELRDLISRAAERGLSPADLAEQGRAESRPAWECAARAWQVYLHALELRSHTSVDAPSRLDSSVLIDRAIERIRHSERTAAVLIDDAQDFTAAGVRLAAALVAASPVSVVASSPDTAVEGFRGALPDAAERIAVTYERAVGAAGAQPAVHRLSSPRSVPGAVNELCLDLASRLPLMGQSSAARRVPEPVEEQTPACAAHEGVSAVACPSAEAEAAHVATAISALVTEHGVDPGEIAVVSRSAGAARDMAERLLRHGVDVEVALRPTPLAEERVIADLFTLIEFALGTRVLERDELTHLLRGPWGGLDDMRLRALRHQAVRATGSEDSLGTLLTALESDSPFDASAWASGARGEYLRALGASVERLRRMRAAIRDARDSGILNTLWAAWSASGLATAWQKEALFASSAGEHLRSRDANARLDALGSLFKAADRYEEREGGEDIGVFVAMIRGQDIPEDSLSPRGRLLGRVSVGTVANLAGTSVDTVILTGVEEGAWPQLRLRSGLLGASHLALALDFPEAPRRGSAGRAVMREAILADEIRLAVAALSRARARVLVTGVKNESSTPSGLFTVAKAHAERHGGGWAADLLSAEAPGPYPSERALIATLARRLSAGENVEAIHALLARLVVHGIHAAHPETWYHQEPSAPGALAKKEDRLRMSPSALETASHCPLAYVLEISGGKVASDGTRTLGTLVHALAEAHPKAGASELIAAFVEVAGSPAPDAPFTERAEYARAIEILMKLGAYQSAHQDVLDVERTFDVPLGPFRAVGTMDRVEASGGGAQVIDYKTSAVPLSADEALTNLQLAAYQRALAEDPIDERPVSGASLVYVGTDAAKTVLRHQPPFDDSGDPAWFDTELERIDRSLKEFPLTITENPHCRVCPVRTSCPLHAEGRTL